jgi:hypothetical protein
VPQPSEKAQGILYELFIQNATSNESNGVFFASTLNDTTTRFVKMAQGRRSLFSFYYLEEGPMNYVI